MLRVDIGKGSVAVIACECLMGNKSLLRADHARIVFDSIPLRLGDHVDILNPVSAESLPALLWRLAAAAILCALAAVGLTIWRNLPRFGRIAASPPPLRRSLAEQIRATARFAWRTRRLASLRRAERRRSPSWPAGGSHSMNGWTPGSASAHWRRARVSTPASCATR